MKKNKAKLPTFVSSDRMKARSAVAYLLETFTHKYIKPVLRGKNKRKKLKLLKSGVNYILNFFEIIRFEEKEDPFNIQTELEKFKVTDK